MGWATRHPECVKGIVVLNTWAFVHDPVMKLPWLFKYLVRGASSYKRVIDKNFFVEKILSRYGTVARMQPQIIDAYRSAHPHPEDRVGIAAFPRMIPETHDVTHPTWRSMATIEAGLRGLSDKPALIIWGTKDPAYREPQLARWWRVFPRHAGPFRVRASHYLQEDAAPEILARIADWLPAVETRSCGHSIGIGDRQQRTCGDRGQRNHGFACADVVPAHDRSGVMPCTAMRVALISDLHRNAVALAAVLRDTAEVGVESHGHTGAAVVGSPPSTRTPPDARQTPGPCR